MGVEQEDHQMITNSVYLQAIINLVELFAVISGTIYISKYRVDKATRYFVRFLWFTIFIELVFGWLPTLIKELESLSFFRETFLRKNYWIYNIYFIISFYVYVNYFKQNIKSKKSRRVLNISVICYVVTACMNLTFSDFYFKTFSSYTFIMGSILFLISIAIFYFEMLKSDNVLLFYKSIPFYVSVGSLVFHLTVTPLFIYSKYFHMSISPEFVHIYGVIFTSANIFLYTCYTIGFIVCLQENKSY